MGIHPTGLQQARVLIGTQKIFQNYAVEDQRRDSESAYDEGLPQISFQNQRKEYHNYHCRLMLL